jgi:D-3-phosphoglycerate dehydrogenase
MKLLIADKLEEEAVSALKALPNLEVVSNPTVSKDALPQALAGVHVLVVRSKEVRAPAIEAAKQLALIVRAGAGTNTIDVEVASARGVYVANCPGKNAIAVAELAVGLMLALDRRLPDATASLKSGRWEKGEFGKADGLFGKRLGIAGLGPIGREVAVRARALGLKVSAWSRSLTHEGARELGLERAESLVALAAHSDILSIHLALKKETRGAISGEVLGALPDRAMVINTARAEVLDYAALRQAIATKGLRVGLDVFPNEPEGGSAAFQDDLLQLPGVVGTPHVGASTQQAQLAIAAETVRIVRSFLETGSVPNCVNLAVRSPVRCQLIVRHFDRVGVLASVLGVIKKHGINVEDMANTPFEGHQAAVAKLSLASLPTEECLREIEQSSGDVIHVEAITV